MPGKDRSVQDEAVAILTELLTWADQMGGWDAPVWERARALVARVTNTPYTPLTIEEDTDD